MMRRKLRRTGTAEVIALSERASRIVRTRPGGREGEGPAAILLFTGVRYERMTEPGAIPPPPASSSPRVEQSA